MYICLCVCVCVCVWVCVVSHSYNFTLKMAGLQAETCWWRYYKKHITQLFCVGSMFETFNQSNQCALHRTHRADVSLFATGTLNFQNADIRAKQIIRKSNSVRSAPVLLGVTACHSTDRPRGGHLMTCHWACDWTAGCVLVCGDVTLLVLLKGIAAIG